MWLCEYRIRSVRFVMFKCGDVRQAEVNTWYILMVTTLKRFIQTVPSLFLNQTCKAGQKCRIMVK